MKRTLLALTLATWMLLGAQLEEIEAAQTEEITITVAMATTLSVSLSGHNIDLGSVAPGSTTESSSAIVVTNDGSGVQEVFSLTHSTSGDWTSGTTPGENTFVLNAAFSENTSGATWTPVDATVSDSVAYGDSRNLWFQFQAPTASTSSAQQTITVTVSAQLP